MSNPRIAMAVVAILGLSVSRPTRGSESSPRPASIGLLARGCGADLREVRELPERLGVELSPVRVETRSAPPLLEVSTTCDAVESVSFRDGDSLQTRPVSLEDVASELRPVALAVLTAEFLRSIWATPQSAGDTGVPAPSSPTEASSASAAPASPAVVQKPVATTPPTSPAHAPREAPTADRAKPQQSERSKGARLGAGALLRYFTSTGSILGGGELSLAGPPLFVAANAAFGSAQDSLGDISLGVVAASIGARLPLAQSGQTTWRAAAAVDMGWTWAEATPTNPESFPRSTETFFAAFTLGPELDIPIDGRFGMTLGIRAGAARGIAATADGRQIAGTQGFTLSSSAIVHYAL